MITTVNALAKNTALLKDEGKTSVLVTGVFDILHQEHRDFLIKAKQEGDVLMVGIETDNRVKMIKGEDRPINSQVVRLKNLDKLQIAQYVFLLPEKFSKPEDHDRLIDKLMPDILAISSHTSHQPEKRAIIEKHHGNLKVVHSHNPAISSTNLINQRNRSV